MSKRRFQIPLDEEYEGSPRAKTTAIPEAVLSRTKDVDAIPTSTAYGEDEDYQRDPVRGIATMPVAKTAECYNTRHPNRGTCLVFNHEVFDARFTNRRGSRIDVNRIRSTFSKLGFNVVIHNDLEYSQIMNNITTLTKEDHSDNDCVCVFVLTHGSDNDYLFAKDAGYRSDSIWKNFSADNCPTLAGKPKLFFIEASRGSKIDEGVTLISQARFFHDAGKRDKLDDGIRLKPLSCKTQPNVPIMSYKIPTPSDFLISHSCTEGFASFRNVIEGTWYVQTLCNVLDEFAESTDLLKMLTLTARIVATDYESNSHPSLSMSGKKQVPSLTSTLTRDLYFTLK